MLLWRGGPFLFRALNSGALCDAAGESERDFCGRCDSGVSSDQLLRAQDVPVREGSEDGLRLFASETMDSRAAGSPGGDFCGRCAGICSVEQSPALCREDSPGCGENIVGRGRGGGRAMVEPVSAAAFERRVTGRVSKSQSLWVSKSQSLW